MWRGKVIIALVSGLTMCAALHAQEGGGKTLTAQDYAEIQQLYVHYAWSVDTHAENGMVYARTFTPDGEFHVGDKTVVGREQLAAYNLTMGVASRAPTHFVTNIMIEPSPEGARGGAYLTITGGEKPTVTAVGTYQDILAKTSEGWRFKRRTLYLNAMPRSTEKRD